MLWGGPTSSTSPAPLKRVFFPLLIVLVPLLKIHCSYMIYFIFSILSHGSLCISLYYYPFVCISLDYSSFVISFEVKKFGHPPTLFFFINIVLVIWGLLYCHTKHFITNFQLLHSNTDNCVLYIRKLILVLPCISHRYSWSTYKSLHVCLLLLGKPKRYSP